MNYYDESMIIDTQCFDIVKTQYKDCYLWNNFFKCFSDYYNSHRGSCSEEKITETLEKYQQPFLRSQASDAMAECYRDSEEEWNKNEDQNDDKSDTHNDFKECPEYFTENELKTSSCQVLLDNPSADCSILNEYAECFSTEMNREYQLDCTSDGVKQRLIDHSISYLKYISGENLRNNCFDLDCDQPNQNRQYDKCVKESQNSNKYNCDNINYLFSLCNIWNSPFCSQNQVNNYVYVEKKQQTEYYLSKCRENNIQETDNSEDFNGSFCDDPKKVSKILDKECISWKNSSPIQDLCYKYNQLAQCTFDKLTQTAQMEKSCSSEEAKKLIDYSETEFSQRLNEDVSKCKNRETRCEDEQIFQSFKNLCNEEVVDSSFPGCDSHLVSIICMDVKHQVCPTDSYYMFFNHPDYLYLNDLKESGECEGVYCASSSSIYTIMGMYCNIPVDDFSNICEHNAALIECTGSKLQQMDNICQYENIRDAFLEFRNNYSDDFGYDPNQCAV